MYRANVKVNLIVKNTTQIKSGITINFSVSVKIQEKAMRGKKKLYLGPCYMYLRKW